MSNDKYPKVEAIISLLGLGVLISAAFVFPGIGRVYREVEKTRIAKRRKEIDRRWWQFNEYQLKRNLNRLYAKNIVETVTIGEKNFIQLTSQGKARFLEHKLKTKLQSGNSWSGKWYVVLYDISKLRKLQQEKFRRKLKEMRFYRFQKSVYLSPYECYDEIEYLRHYFGLNREVTMMEANKIEHENLYRRYFGLR